VFLKWKLSFHLDSKRELARQLDVNHTYVNQAAIVAALDDDGNRRHPKLIERVMAKFLESKNFGWAVMMKVFLKKISTW